MAEEIEKILAECRMNLKRGRAVATGIGRFAEIIRNGDPLLRKRLEKGSLYQKDLSGKWELPGGGAEINHFKIWAKDNNPEKRYGGSVFETLKQELMEEAGLKLLDFPGPTIMLPADILKEYTDEKTKEERITIDLAFVIPIPFNELFIAETEVFREKMEKGELMFVPRKELQKIDIVSPRMRYLIKIGLEFNDLFGL